MQGMKLAGMQKLTLLDYPGKAAATVFTPGCNLRCPYCQNTELVTGATLPDGSTIFPAMPEQELFDLLQKRHGLLDGVCITGGEPTLQPDLAAFCQRIHEMGFLVKLDTNGTQPQRLQVLLSQKLVDYVAMDVKNAPPQYARTCGLADMELGAIADSMDALAASDVPYEFRTTVTFELHQRVDLLQIAEWLRDAPAWYLQSYRDSPQILGGAGHFHPWPPQELHALLPELRRHCAHVELRGID